MGQNPQIAGGDQPPPASPEPPFPWAALPAHLQETILSLVPVSTLLRLLPVSRPLRSLIHSPSFLLSLRLRPRLRADSFFLLFTDSHHPSSSSSSAAAFHPSSGRWLLLPVPPSLHAPLASASSLAVFSPGPSDGCLFAARLLSRSAHRPLPPMNMLDPYYVIAVVATDEYLPPADFKVLAVSTRARLLSQVYDSRLGRWDQAGELDGRFSLVGNNAVPLDGILYVLSFGPHRLLTFDPNSGLWENLDVAMPPNILYCHLLVFKKRLFLVGGLEELAVLVCIGIWELDRSAMGWKEVCFMPEVLFEKFGGSSLSHFDVVDRMGIICLYNRAESPVLMFDLAARRWWWLPPCHLIPRSRRRWYGHAAEPSIDLFT